MRITVHDRSANHEAVLATWRRTGTEYRIPDDAWPAEDGCECWNEPPPPDGLACAGAIDRAPDGGDSSKRSKPPCGGSVAVRGGSGRKCGPGAAARGEEFGRKKGKKGKGDEKSDEVDVRDFDPATGSSYWPTWLPASDSDDADPHVGAYVLLHEGDDGTGSGGGTSSSGGTEASGGNKDKGSGQSSGGTEGTGEPDDGRDSIPVSELADALNQLGDVYYGGGGGIHVAVPGLGSGASDMPEDVFGDDEELTSTDWEDLHPHDVHIDLHTEYDGDDTPDPTDGAPDDQTVPNYWLQTVEVVPFVLVDGPELGPADAAVSLWVIWQALDVLVRLIEVVDEAACDALYDLYKEVCGWERGCTRHDECEDLQWRQEVNALCAALRTAHFVHCWNPAEHTDEDTDGHVTAILEALNAEFTCIHRYLTHVPPCP